MTNSTATLVRSDLHACTIEALRAYFDRQGHLPSPAHWAALDDIAVTLTDMAKGTCQPMTLLSACDPGVGKSQTVRHWLHALVADKTYLDVGAIICVGRLEEAKALAADLDIPSASLEVLTSDLPTNRTPIGLWGGR